MSTPAWLVRTPVERIRELLPTGHLLPEDAWRSRHRFIVTVLWLHAVGLPLFGVLAGIELLHSVVEGASVALAAIVAGSERFDRVLRASVATVGLVSSSAILVHFSGGFIEAHFHFFVMLGLITMYQSWIPFLLAIGYVVVHHGAVGMLVPAAVYNHPDAVAQPWKWAAIHAAFVLGASAAYIAAWRMTEHQALHDALTQLPNRVLFRDRMVQAIARSARRQASVALMVLDVDDFKAVNDTLGHSAGDRLLMTVAERLRSAVRSTDTVARLGGDEFAILAEDLTEPHSALTAVERVIEALAPAFTLDGATIAVGASIGVVVGAERDRDRETWLRNADVAMYQAKARGKRRYVIFEPSMAPVPTPARPQLVG